MISEDQKKYDYTMQKTGRMRTPGASFHQAFIKLGEYVDGHNISTKFYNQSNPRFLSELWPLTCLKLRFPLT